MRHNRPPRNARGAHHTGHGDEHEEDNEKDHLGDADQCFRTFFRFDAGMTDNGRRLFEFLCSAIDNSSSTTSGRGILLPMTTKPLYEDPWFTFRFADSRLVPRFHLEGIEAGRQVTAFKVDPATGKRLGLLVTATV